MIEKPMDVLVQFPIRKNKKQKQSFRDAVQPYAESLGYAVTMEKGSAGSVNVVMGDPKTAKYLVTAHYDTPARMIVPNLITPCNPVTFLAYQLLIVAMFFLVAFGLGFAAGFVLDDAALAGTVAMTAYWILLIMMLLGPANKHNANDNTSGVVSVLETAAKLPEELRSKVCFVLFDLEEAGLIGSASYAKKHKAEIKNQIILNCDCVGDGDELMFFPTKKLKKDADKMAQLLIANYQDGKKSLTVHEKGYSVYPSDQKNFPYGVGIAAFRRSKWAGLYCDKIHTNKDTILEEENVTILCDRLIALFSTDAAK